VRISTPASVASGWLDAIMPFLATVEKILAMDLWRECATPVA
jgi:hypothetical protein